MDNREDTERADKMNVAERKGTSNEKLQPEVESTRFMNDQTSGDNGTTKKTELLLNDVNSKFNRAKSEVDDRRVFKTIALYVCFLILGLSMPLTGASIVHMEILLGESTRRMSFAFTGIALGILIGSWICGLLFDCTNKEFAFLAAIAIKMLSTIATTFVSDLYAFIATVSLQGLAFGFIITAAQAYCVSLWSTHRLKEPLLQLLHTIWSLGGAIGPYFMKPFLAELKNGYDCNDTYNSSEINSTMISSHSINCTMANFERSDEELNNITLARYSYLATGIAVGVSGIPYLILYFHRREPFHITKKQAIIKNGHSTTPDIGYAITSQVKTSSTIIYPGRCFLVLLLTLIGSFYFLTMYVEGIPMWLFPTFVIKKLQWSVRDSVVLMSIYFGLQCTGRVLGIPLSVFLRPRTMLVANIGITAIAFFLIIFVENNHMLMWIATGLAGLAMASTFPSMVLWMSETMEITGAISSLLMTGSSIGLMTGPVLAGQLMDIYGDMWIIYLLNIASMLHVVQFIAIFFCLVTLSRFQDRQHKMSHRVE